MTSKQMKPIKPCKCLSKSPDLLRPEVISSPRKQYHDRKSWERQQDFCAPTSESLSQTNLLLSFFMTGGAHGQEVEICRKMLIGLFSFSENKLMAVTQRMTNLSSHDQFIPEVGTDGRGRSRTNVYRRVPEDILESIDEMIIKIIKKKGEPSHWNRN